MAERLLNDRKVGKNMATALKVEDLCKTYVINKRQNNVLRNVNFTVEKGEYKDLHNQSHHPLWMRYNCPIHL